MRLLAIALALLSAPVLAHPQATDPATRREHGRHTDTAAYIRMLESPSRDAYQKPAEVVAALGLKPGAVIADIGSGSGYFALPLARAVGESGTVFAVDVEPDMVRHLERRAGEAGVRNIHAILAPADDPTLPEHAVDMIFVCDTWHHIEKPQAYLAAIRRALKPRGRVVMIDYHKRPLPVGPSMEFKIAREDLLKQMQENGFRLVKEHTFLPYQYFLVFEPAPA